MTFLESYRRLGVWLSIKLHKLTVLIAAQLQMQAALDRRAHECYCFITCPYALLGHIGQNSTGRGDDATSMCREWVSLFRPGKPTWLVAWV